jgi:eukaryotic-like serine/threonine-protein kinase
MTCRPSPFKGLKTWSKLVTLRHRNDKKSVMFKRFSTVLAALAAGAALITGCSKNTSSDNPLPSSYNASVVVGGDNFLVSAIDPVTGLKNWNFSTAGPIVASPLIYNEMVYVGTYGAAGCDTLYKLNVQTGALVKRIVVPSAYYKIAATPTADANLIYLACTNNMLYAIDTGTYAVKWSFPTGGPIMSSPVVYNGYVYFGCDDGSVYGIDKTLGPSGTSNWSWNPVSGGIHTYPTKFRSSPAIGATRTAAWTDTPVLCIGADDSSVYCFQLVGGSTGNVFKWAFKTGGSVESSPSIYGGACVFGSFDDTVYCVDIITGADRWKYGTKSEVYSSPYCVNNVVYIGSYDYNLYALNFTNGQERWSFATAGLIKSSPIAYGNNIYVGSFDKSVYAIDSTTGQLKWKFLINNNIQCSPAIDANVGGFGINSAISGLTN